MPFNLPLNKNFRIGDNPVPFIFFILFLTGAFFYGGASYLYADVEAPAIPQPRRYKVSQPALAQGRFLVATRNMRDPKFSETVILIVEYGWHGTIGLILNRPTKIRLSEAVDDVKGLERRPGMVYYGGPVDRVRIQALIRASKKPEDSQHVFDDVYVSTSSETLQRIVDEDSGEKFRVYSGYAGWAPRQLEWEVMTGGWQVIQADADTVFEKKPSEIWPTLFNAP